MVKILSSSINEMLSNAEQLRDGSPFLIKSDDPPLEELDPAILSCGLPAIILSEVRPIHAPPIRYTIEQLLSYKKSVHCFRRPLAADDPKVSSFAIWRHHSQLNRRSKPHAGNFRKDDKDKGTCGSIAKGHHQERADKQKQPARQENGYIGPRFRQNYQFSNRNHHVIVRSYRGENDDFHTSNNNVENEPEWVSAGPTSRLDTIELRGFDDDVLNNDNLAAPSSSWGKASHGVAKNCNKISGQPMSFYDDLHHYEHVVNAKRNETFLKPYDSFGRENDVESVTTSNTGSPPPARSTPTKLITDGNGKMADDNQKHNGVNVNNFEKFMKFDSLLGSESASRSKIQPGSGSNRWFRCGNNQQVDSNNDRGHFSFNMTHGGSSSSGNRYPLDRNCTQHYPYRSTPSFNNVQNDTENHHPQNELNTAYKRVMEMIAQNRANSSNQTAQEQYMLQMLNKTHQSEILRRMLIKNTVDGGGSNGAQQQQQQQTTKVPRIPTQLELQIHTQTIMQNALLRKKLQDQHKLLMEQNSNLAAIATAPNIVEPNAEVQQFVKSVSPNLQRSLSILNQASTTDAGHYQSFNQPFPGATNAAVNNPLYIGGPNQLDLSASLRQILLPQQQELRQFGNRRRSGKKSVTWKNPV